VQAKGTPEIEASVWIQIKLPFFAAGLQRFENPIRVRPLSNRGGAEIESRIQGRSRGCSFLFIASSQN
jgi:hypothetical protein